MDFVLLAIRMITIRTYLTMIVLFVLINNSPVLLLYADADLGLRWILYLWQTR